MLDLPAVTLCAVDCVNPLLTLRALDLCGRQCRFGEVLFLSDSADQYELAGCRTEPIPRIGSRAEYSRFILKELAQYCHTKHLLLIQWDGYIVNPDAWRPEFLEYDYIGAPWGSYQDEHRVGNGGFSLRSRRLLDALLDAVIVDLDPEDEAIGRRYRTLLEAKHGIRFAPEQTAAAFAFETTYPKGRPFGFHGLFNMWLVLPQQELAEFVSVLAPSSVAGRQFLQLGKNYLELGRKEEAAVVLKRRLEVTPEDTEARRLLASVTSPASISPPSTNRAPGRNDPCPCGSGKRYKQCCGNIAGARQMATPQPSADHPGVLLQNAVDHHQAGRLEAAEALYRRVLADDSQNAVALQYLGVLTMQRGNPAQGEEIIRQALGIRSDLPDFHNNLGLCLRQQGRFREAQTCYRQALAIKPDHAAAYNNLGLDLQATGEVTEAVTAFKQALQLQPQFAEAHWNLGLAYLTQGNLAEGWAEYEWRLRCQPFSSDGMVLNSISPWRGESIAGKILLVRREQGLGDTIQFLRFVPRLIQSGARVLLDVPPVLAKLSKTIAPAVELLDPTGPHPKADFYVNLMSLPYWQGITLDNLPRATPYLSSDPAKVALWQTRLRAFSGKKIGIVWSGNLKVATDRYRSPGLAALLPLLQTPGAAWVSLQKEPRSGDAALLSSIPQIHDFTSQLTDFSETAALIGALDLVITSDTSVAHLAGALGKPAWVMIHYSPDWRWQLDREDSPWYPSIRLFRQQQPNDWQKVIDKMRSALRIAVR